MNLNLLADKLGFASPLLDAKLEWLAEAAFLAQHSSSQAPWVACKHSRKHQDSFELEAASLSKPY